MNDKIEQLIARYNTKAEQLSNSIETVTTSEIYSKERDKWEWYLKGQQHTLQTIALELQTLLLTKKIEDNENSAG